MSSPDQLIGGIEKLPVVIADYDPQWPVRYEVERARIANALGPMARRIDHVGSTSVPGLAAKPIIDIQVEVADVNDDSGYSEALVNAGYVLRVRESDHRLFRTPELDVHVHLWSPGEEIERHLLFRDWLRDNRADRGAYEDLKRELAKRDWDDRNQYAEAKSELIGEILQRAESARMH